MGLKELMIFLCALTIMISYLLVPWTSMFPVPHRKHRCNNIREDDIINNIPDYNTLLQGRSTGRDSII